MAAQPAVIIIFDSSNSMWGRVEGRPKYQAGQETLRRLIDEWPLAVELGLWAYGHRRKVDCADVEELIPLGPLDRAAALSALAALTPRGKTPLAESIRQVVEKYKDRGQVLNLILVSDGKETCRGEPCALVEKYRLAGVELNLNVIGFDVPGEDRAELECIAEAGGAKYRPAKSAAELELAIRRIVEEALLPEGPGLAVGAVRHCRPARVWVAIVKLDGAKRETIRYGDTLRFNPQLFKIEPGTYEIQVSDDSLDQAPVYTRRVVYKGDKHLETFYLLEGYLNLEVTKAYQRAKARVEVWDSRTKIKALERRTDDENPLRLKLLPGVYDIKIFDPEIKDIPVKVLPGIRLDTGQTIDRAVNLPQAGISVTVLINGRPGRGEIDVYKAGTEDQVGSGDSSAETPFRMRLLPGEYDIRATDTNVIAPTFPTELKRGVRIGFNETKELTFAFEEGTLNLRLIKDGRIVAGVYYIFQAGTGDEIESGRHQPGKPVILKLLPGEYDLMAEHKAGSEPLIQRIEGIRVKAGQAVYLDLNFRPAEPEPKAEPRPETPPQETESESDPLEEPPPVEGAEELDPLKAG